MWKIIKENSPVENFPYLSDGGCPGGFSTYYINFTFTGVSMKNDAVSTAIPIGVTIGRYLASKI